MCKKISYQYFYWCIVEFEVVIKGKWHILHCCFLLEMAEKQKKKLVWPKTPLHCTLIRGGIVIQPGLNINYSLHHSAFWSYLFVCSTNFNYCRFYNYAQWEILSIITNFNFCMPFFSMLSLFNLKIFLSLLKLAIINVFCKVSCRIWILKHGMNQAILFLVFFFIYFLKKIFKKKNFKKKKKKKKFKFF